VSLQEYLSTGYYIHNCDNGVQQPITGSGIFTSLLNQCDADGKAYYLAIQNALYLREISPCLSDPTGSGTTTTTTTATTTVLPYVHPSGNIFYDWTGDFNGENGAYYDIVAWGSTEGYLSGNQFLSNQYFSNISANDLNGQGTVLAVIKNSGLVTGFGSNIYQQLDIPSGLTGVLEVSLGYDHAIALLNNNTVTGWGRDNYGALNINATLPRNVRRALAGINSSVFLLASGIITGTQTIGGGIPVTYPPSGQSGYLNIDYYASHILALDSNGLLIGMGQNAFGESNIKNINGVSKLCAAYNSNFLVYNDGYVTGYGYSLSTNNLPNILNSGKNIQLRRYLGTILYKDQDISQWNSRLLSFNQAPSYLDNNVVAISQGLNFTAAIYKRPCIVASQSVTGYNYLWKVTGLGFEGISGYGGININDLYPPLGTVTQTCNCHSFTLPQISSSDTVYTQTDVPDCASGDSHSIYFVSIRNQWPLLNINYTITGYAPKTGFAATGITTGDYWNPKQSGDFTNKPLFYSDRTLSPVSGGFFETSGMGTSFSHNDNMYATMISGSGGYPLLLLFDHFETGSYSGYFYGHGPTSGQNSKFIVSKNAEILINGYTSSGVGFDSTIFSGNNQYLKTSFNITETGDYIFIICSGFINGIQFIKT